jgi:hypothetical protein
MRLAYVLMVACVTLAANIAQAASLPREAVVLPGRVVGVMLHQCSRETPAMGESTWQPSVDDILALEATLPQALMAQAAKNDPDWSKAPLGWRRQYVGMVLKGRRLIYGNFIPSDFEPGSWRAYPQIICDGGPRVFGVVYDVAAHRIINLAFNGEA